MAIQIHEMSKDASGAIQEKFGPVDILDGVMHVKDPTTGIVQHINLSDVNIIRYSQPSKNINNIVVWEKNPPKLTIEASLTVFDDTPTSCNVEIGCTVTISPKESAKYSLVKVIIGQETFIGHDSDPFVSAARYYSVSKAAIPVSDTITIYYDNKIVAEWSGGPCGVDESDMETIGPVPVWTV